jgi:hypothetical protein
LNIGYETLQQCLKAGGGREGDSGRKREGSDNGIKLVQGKLYKHVWNYHNEIPSYY